MRIIAYVFVATCLTMPTACNGKRSPSAASLEESSARQGQSASPATATGEELVVKPNPRSVSLGEATSVTPADDAMVLLPVPARSHAPERPPAGWCAETAIQEALLYYGAFMPQRAINRAGKPKHPDLYWSDIPRAMKRIGLSYRRWSGKNRQRVFLDWVENQIDAGHPVIAGVKIHPTEHPQWGLDHIVLIVGYDDSALFINTTWGYRERTTHAQLASKEKGLSFNNRYGRYYAYAIDGWRNDGSRSVTHSGIVPVTLSVNENGTKRMRGTVAVADLAIGRAYELARYRRRGEQPVDTRVFTATARRHRFAVEIERADTAYFTVVAAPEQ